MSSKTKTRIFNRYGYQKPSDKEDGEYIYVSDARERDYLKQLKGYKKPSDKEDGEYIYVSDERERDYLKKLKETVPFWTSQRFVLAVFAFFGMFNAFALRSNISLSIVCMVNHTALNPPQLDENTTNYEATVITNLSSSSLLSLSSECSWIDTEIKQNSSKSSYKDGELVWDRRIQGYVLGAFFWAYSIVQIPSGILVTKYGGKRVFGWSMILASITTVVTPLASRSHYICAIALRAVLGICLGPCYPSIQYLWGRWAPPDERSRLSALSFPGGEVGSMVAFVLAGFLCRYGIDGGWASTFYLTGIFAFIWAALWLAIVSDSPQRARRISVDERNYISASLRFNPLQTTIRKKKRIPWKDIFTSPKVYAIIVTHFTTDWANYLMLACIPTYIDDVLKFRIEDNGLISALPYIPHCVVALSSGWLADFIHSRGLPRGATRKLFNSVAKIIPACMLIGLGYIDCSSPITAVTVMTVSIAFRGFRFAGYIVNVIDIAPEYAGLIFGISNTGGAFAGFLATLMVSNVTRNSLREEWQTVFYATAAIEIFGALYFVFFASSDVQPWASQSEEINVVYERKLSKTNNVDIASRVKEETKNLVDTFNSDYTENVKSIKTCKPDNTENVKTTDTCKSDNTKHVKPVDTCKSDNTESVKPVNTCNSNNTENVKSVNTYKPDNKDIAKHVDTCKSDNTEKDPCSGYSRENIKSMNTCERDSIESRKSVDLSISENVSHDKQDIYLNSIVNYVS